MQPVTQIASGVYMFSYYNPQNNLSFNQYLIAGEQPTLIHTGTADRFEGLRASLEEIMDIRDLAYIVISHFEGDEGGAAMKFLPICPQVQVICSEVCSRQFAGFGLELPFRIVKENDTLTIGQKTLRFLSYPSEAHLWPGIMPFEEKSGMLFSSDIFTRRGAFDKNIVSCDLAEELRRGINEKIPACEQQQAFSAKLLALPVKIIAPGHGPSLVPGSSDT